MSKVIKRAGKVIISIFIPFIIACLLIYSSFANSKQTSSVSQDTVSDVPTRETSGPKVINREELVELRNDHTRVWQITKLVEQYDHKSGQYEEVEEVSKIVEKGCGICYSDQAGQWQVTDTGWVETSAGFEMKKAGYQLEIGKVIGSPINYNVDGEQLNLRPSSLYLDDGKSADIVAQVNPQTEGYIDPDRPNVLIFKNALGAGIDIEYEAMPGGYHQNVIFDTKPAMDKRDLSSQAKYRLYTEIDMDSYVADAEKRQNQVSVKVEGENEEASNGKYAFSSLADTHSTKGDINFVLEDSEGKERVTHQFAESRILGAKNKDEKAEKHIVKTSDKTYLVESVDFDVINEAEDKVVWDYQTRNGTLPSDEVWYSCNTYYLSSNVTVDADKVLKIEPGTVVKFDQYVSLDVNGTLIANGSSELPIVFTSSDDNSVGEEIPWYLCNGTAIKGDWYGISLISDMGCEVSFCEIKYAIPGIGIRKTGITDLSYSPEIFHDNLFYENSIGVQCNSANIVVKNNIFKGCTSGIDFAKKIQIKVLNNTFDGSGYTNSSGIYFWDSLLQTDIVDIRNNIFVNSKYSIEGAYEFLTNYFPTIFNESNNAFYNLSGSKAIQITGYDEVWNPVDIYPQSDSTDVTLTSSPFDATNTILGYYHLNTDSNGGALLIDAGDAVVSNYYDVPTDWSVYHVPMDGTHGSTQSVTLTTDTTWQPNYATCDTGTVDIGYHYPRIDYAFNVIGNTTGTELEILPNTAVKFVNSPQCWFNGKLKCNGTPDNYVSLIGEADFYTLGDHGCEIMLTTIYNVDILGFPMSEFVDNVLFNSIISACSPESGVLNNLWINSYIKTSYSVVNNTFYGKNSGIVFEDDNVICRNNIFMHNDRGIYLQYIEPITSFVEEYNLYHDNFDRIYWTDMSGNSQPITYLGTGSYDCVNVSDIYEDHLVSIGEYFYLKTNGYAVNAGSDQVKGMLGTTTQSNLAEDVAPLDIGYHYPLNIDTDNDGLYDFQEGRKGSDIYSTDTDGDGLSDYDEVRVYYCDPLDIDSDDDQMPDDWEVSYSLDPSDPSDATYDSDGDGLRNLDEYKCGLVPNSQDLPDGALHFYDDSDNLIREIKIDSTGGVMVHAETVEYEYDILGRKILERKYANYIDGIDNEEDRVVLYEYNADNTLDQVIYKAYNSGAANTDITQAESGDIIEKYYYDSISGQLEKKTKFAYESSLDSNYGENRGSWTEYTYINGVVTETSVLADITLNSNGSIVANSEVKETTHSDYDSAGRISKITDSNGHYILFNYNSLGQKIAQTSYDHRGTVGDTTDDEPVMQTRSEYNGLGNITRQATMADASTALTTDIDIEVDSVVEYVYKPYDDTYQADNTAAGKLICQKRYYGCTNPATTTGYDGKIGTTVYDYDVFGRQDSIYDFGDKFDYADYSSGLPDFTTETPYSETLISYDLMNRTSAKRQIDRCTDPTITDVIDITTAYEYDCNGNMTAVSIQPDPQDSQTWQTTHYTYQLGRVMTETTPASVVNVYAYDSFGNNTSEVKDDGGLEQITDRTFNRLGRMTTITGYTDSAATVSQTTAYAYDYAGNVTDIMYPDYNGTTHQGWISYTYYRDGQVKTRTDARNILTDYAIEKVDGYKQLTKTVVQDGITYTEVFVYDPLGNIASAVKNKTDSGITTTISDMDYTYNGFGKVSQCSDAYFEEATPKISSYSYDNAIFRRSSTNLANVTYPTFRDWKGRKTGELLTFASYDFIGDKIARKTHANYSYYGRTDFKYDELGRIERLHSYRIYDTIADLYYSYEPGTNNISDITYAHKPSTPENSYVYDDINRLTQATYFSDLNDNEVFTLDNLGNRSNVNLRSGSDLAYQIDTDTNQYSQIGGNNISYDNAGNLSVDENGYIYSYDYENRLVKVNDGSYDIVTYDYDALGRRIRMTDMSGENDIVTTYYYNDNWQVIGEYKTGMPVKSYYYGNGIDEVLVSYYGVSGGSITGITVYSLDHLNSPIAVIDNTGNIVERYEYSAYGEADIFTAGTDGTYFTADDVHDLTVSTVDNRISFTGRELDILDGGDLRIMYYRNRYYTPTHGRFLTKDPLGIVPYARLGNELFFVSFQYIDGINVYQYARSNTVNNIDSLGLAVRVYFDCVLTDTQKEGCRKRCFYFCYDNGKKREILHYPPEPTDVDDPRIPSTFELVESTFRWGKCDKKISKVKIFGDLPNWPTNCSRSACRERAEAAKTAGEWACKLVPNKGGSVLCEAAVIAAYEAAMAACDMCENP